MALPAKMERLRYIHFSPNKPARRRKGLGSCDWRYVTFLNCPVAPQVIKSWLPYGTEVDTWQGQAWLSLVGVTVKHSQLFGLRLPSQQNYEQVNLRFYVTRRVGTAVRRGFVLVREIVPRPILAFMLRRVFKDHCVCREMNRKIRLKGNIYDICYAWQNREAWCKFEVSSNGSFKQPDPDSLQAFLSHRLWVYAKAKHDESYEIRLDHPRWNTADASMLNFKLPDESLFGKPLSQELKCGERNAFLAEGSKMRIMGIRRLGS